MAIADGDEGVLAAKFAVMRPFLDERGWRVYLGTEARALGYGGVAAVARAAGVSATTVAAGAAEAADPAALGVLARGRSRRAGAGRPAAEDTPGLKQALDALLEEGKRGDPMSAVTWNILSLRGIARQMAALGWNCSKDTAARLMHQDGYSLRAMSKVLEGSQHEDRDAQFGYINARIEAYRAAGEPVISVDGKKKERLGAYHRQGRSWRPAGDPVQVRSHDFADKDTVTITPYGIYDIAANRGFVCVGTSGDTAAFSVNAIALWWQEEGSLRYPDATRLLVTCDCGGSNSARGRLWKDRLAWLAEQTGLEIEVCHFPPGTSKWNKIEHRLFCHITRTWQARPLMSTDDAVAGIAATITGNGLKCRAVRDDAVYPTGIQVSDDRMRYLSERVIGRAAFHGEWNYAIAPAPRPAPGPGPEPGPGPGRPGRCPQDILNHPALTGMDPADLRELAAALEIPFGARREQDSYLRRGGQRVRPAFTGTRHGKRKIDLLDHVLALRLRDHLHLTTSLAGTLLGADRSTISHATSLTRQLLDTAAIPLPPAAPPPGTRLRTPEDLHAYATAAGITLTIPGTSTPAPAPAPAPAQPGANKRKPATRPKHPTK